MNKRDNSHREAVDFFEELWSHGDPWDLESSDFERAKYDRQIAMLPRGNYRHVLEIGCGAGVFTRQLARVADRIVALDISRTAILRARLNSPPESIEFRVANIMEFDFGQEAPWDLIVMSETVYYLGWLYPFFDVGGLASQIFTATAPGGHLLMANTCGGVDDYLLRPWLIRTYHNLFVNCGYHTAGEEIFRGVKNGIALEALMSVFAKESD